MLIVITKIPTNLQLRAAISCLVITNKLTKTNSAFLPHDRAVFRPDDDRPVALSGGLVGCGPGILILISTVQLHPIACLLLRLKWRLMRPCRLGRRDRRLGLRAIGGGLICLIQA